MAPKGKKSLSFWQKCEECSCIFSAKDIINHHEFCNLPQSDWSCGYIQNKTLYGSFEDSKNRGISLPEGTKDYLKPEHVKEIIFLSQSAMQLCGFPIGFPVVVELAEFTTILKAWPSSEGSLTTVHFNKEELEFKFGNELKCSQVKVSKVEPKPFMAKEVCFEFLNMPENTQASDCSRTFPLNFKNKVIFVGMILIAPFYGKKLRVKISRAIDYGHDISENLEHLNLSNIYYITSENTVWVNHKLDQKGSKIHKKNKIKIGGYRSILSELEKNISYTFSEKQLREGPCSFCVLLYGSSGTGKTAIAQYLAQNSGKEVINIQGSELFSKFYGETENCLRHCFKEAINKAPCIVLLDNIDTLCSRKGSDLERRVLSTLLSLFDSIRSSSIVVIATTVDPDVLDSSLRRPGRLEMEVEINIPDKNDRFEILKILLPDLSLHDTLQNLASICHGFVGADLASIIDKAVAKASLNSEPAVTAEYLEWAFTQVRPSAMRQLLVHVPSVRWTDIGGGKHVRLRLEQAVEWPLRYADSLKRLGIKAPKGVLLYGPPGCSKTLLVKALATETNLNFISIKGSDIFSKWVGESEKAIRDLFRTARKVAPAIVFIDEADALGASRGTSTGNTVHDRVLSQLLTEMDGVNPLDGVVVIAATNRPDCIDKALLRPGRIDRIIYVPLPDYDTRHQIFEIQLKKIPCEGVSIDDLAEKTAGYSGAEIVAVCTEAAMTALQEDMNVATVKMSHFESALKIMTPRTPQSLLTLYDEYRKQKEIE